MSMVSYSRAETPYALAALLYLKFAGKNATFNRVQIATIED